MENWRNLALYEKNFGLTFTKKVIFFKAVLLLQIATLISRRVTFAKISQQIAEVLTN